MSLPSLAEKTLEWQTTRLSVLEKRRSFTEVQDVITNFGFEFTIELVCKNWESKLAKTSFDMISNCFQLLVPAGAFVDWPDLSCQMEVKRQRGTLGKATSLAKSWCTFRVNNYFAPWSRITYISSKMVNLLGCSNWNLAFMSTLRSWSFHHIPSYSIPSRHSMTTWIHKVMTKHHGGPFALDHGPVNVHIPRHGYPASFWDTRSEISHLIHLEFVCPEISKLPHCACLHKVPSHRDTNICPMPSDSTRGKSTPPKFASRKMRVKDASVRQAKAALNWQASRVFTSSSPIPHRRYCGYSSVGVAPEASTCSLSIVDSDIETSPLFGEGMIINDVVSELAA